MNNLKALNLIGSYNVASDAKFNNPFTKNLYPLKRQYKDFLLPCDHPWNAQATQEMEKLKSAIESRDLKAHFKNYVTYARLPNETFSNKELPFVIKLHMNQDTSIDSSEPYPACVKRSLLSARCARFIQEENIDRVVIPKKFIFPIDLDDASTEISDRTHVVIVEKLAIVDFEKDYQTALKIWDNLDPSVKERQKAQIAYVISQLGYLDAHKKNVVLLKNGKFSIIDFDEPYPSCNKIFKELLTQTDKVKQNSLLRLEEIANAKKGLVKLLDCKARMNPYNRAANALLFNKYMALLDDEILEINTYEKCQAIIENKFFNSFISTHYQEKNLRKENLEKRVFFLLRNRLFFQKGQQS